MTQTPFDLYVKPGFEAVADAFKANFSEELEHGAAFCVIQNDRIIIDLKGGWADREKTMPLSDDHLIAVFSSGKAVASLVLATLVEDDVIGYEQEIASIWPEFDQYGKGSLSVAQIMSHQSGLSGITNPNWQAEYWFDWDKTCDELSRQKPIFPPGSASGYHPVTFGFLAGQIVRRTDIAGRKLGDVLRQDICIPHDLDIWIGLPESEHHRCADMIKPKSLAKLGDINLATRAAFLEKWSSPGRMGIAEWRKAELAGSNCHANSKSLARFMQMAIDGRIDEETYLSEDVLKALHKPRISGPDQVLPFDLTFTAGLIKNDPHYFYGPNPDTIGHSGWGGSCLFADPDAGLSVAYVMNRQDGTLLGNPRPQRLIQALYAAL